MTFTGDAGVGFIARISSGEYTERLAVCFISSSGASMSFTCSAIASVVMDS